MRPATGRALTTSWRTGRENAIVDIITTHQAYLLVNIGNEVGDDSVTDGQFTTAIPTRCKRMRSAGIHTPLVDRRSRLRARISTLLTHRRHPAGCRPGSQSDLLRPFVLGVADGADAQFIRSGLQRRLRRTIRSSSASSRSSGAFDPGSPISVPRAGYVDYQTIILQECPTLGSAGMPGSGGRATTFGGAGCEIMDITTDNTIANLNPAGRRKWSSPAPLFHQEHLRQHPLIPAPPFCVHRGLTLVRPRWLRSRCALRSHPFYPGPTVDFGSEIAALPAHPSSEGPLPDHLCALALRTALGQSPGHPDMISTETSSRVAFNRAALHPPRPVLDRRAAGQPRGDERLLPRPCRSQACRNRRTT